MIRNRIRVIRQQRKAMDCGQLTIAMLTGKSIQDVYVIYGHNMSTNMKEHNVVLLKLGIRNDKFQKVDNRKTNLKSLLSDISIIRIKYGTRNMGHLALLFKGKIYDCAHGEHETMEEYLKFVSDKSGSKVLVSHFINVYEN